METEAIKEFVEAAIPVLGIERKRLPAVLNCKANAFGAYRRAIAIVVALNEGTAIAILVDNRQIDRVAVVELWVTRRHVGGGVIRINPLHLPLSIRF